MRDYGENGNIPEGKCSKIWYKFSKYEFYEIVRISRSVYSRLMTYLLNCLSDNYSKCESMRIKSVKSANAWKVLECFFKITLPHWSAHYTLSRKKPIPNSQFSLLLYFSNQNIKANKRDFYVGKPNNK